MQTATMGLKKTRKVLFEGELTGLSYQLNVDHWKQSWCFLTWVIGK